MSNIDFSKICTLSEKQIRRRYKYIGEGISRKVYKLSENYVLKLAKGNEGLYQNKVENYIYTNISPKLKKYLCPILFFKPEIIIMKKAIPLSKHVKNEFIDLSKIRPEKSSLEDLNYISTRYFLYYEDVISTSSWGKLNENNVLIDYGCTNYLGDIYYEVLFHL